MERLGLTNAVIHSGNFSLLFAHVLLVHMLLMGCGSNSFMNLAGPC